MSEESKITSTTDDLILALISQVSAIEKTLKEHIDDDINKRASYEWVRLLLNALSDDNDKELKDKIVAKAIAWYGTHVLPDHSFIWKMFARADNSADTDNHAHQDIHSDVM